MGLFFDDIPLEKSNRVKKPDTLTMMNYARKERRIITDAEMCALPVGSDVLYDVELYPNFFFVGFLHEATNSYFYVEMSPATGGVLDREKLRFIMWRFCLTGFNTKLYDLPIIEAALKGASLTQLKELSDRIIIHDEKIYGSGATFNEIDLIEVAPLGGSLKLYAARLHTERIQELPIPAHTVLTADQAAVVRDYNFNDLDCTKDLKHELEPHLELRRQLGHKYEKDFRSLSDAQIAERIITIEIETVLGRKVKKPGYESAQGLVFKYEAPSYVCFQTEQLKTMLADICNASIAVDINGYARCPPEIEGRQITIAGRTYAIGLGGLHSQEKSQAIVRTATTKIKDIDVTGYYPNLILRNKFASKHLGEVELAALQNMVDTRTAAKRAGDDVTASGLKIGCNGEFGKKSDPYSIVYDPNAMVLTTLTGQLSLLMLIEHLTLLGFQVVSANTDGVVTIVPNDREEEFGNIIKMWEAHTSLETEETQYAALYSRDVNNYIAVKYKFDKEKKVWTDQIDGCKCKGIYSDKGSALNSPLSKNPEMQICSDAVQAFLTKHVPIDRTIYDCNDMRKFVSVRNVKGGAHKSGVYLGKVVRWYYAKGETGEINYVLSGNKVPKSQGARPLMEMPPGFVPDDLDRNFYEKEALEMLYDIGYNKRAEQQRLFA